MAITTQKLATFLDIAHKQRARQRDLFKTQFGPESAAVAEIEAELAELVIFINQLRVAPITPIEDYISKSAKK